MSTICPAFRAGARTFLIYNPNEESVSEDPPMLIDGPIPSTLIEEISVTFLPQFLGAFS